METGQSKYLTAKILRKQKRCQAIVSKETGLESSDDPTKVICVCNAGLSTALQEEILLDEISRYGEVVQVVMLPKMSYCFFECMDLESSQKIYSNVHAKAKLGQSGTVLYLSFFKNLPTQSNTWKEDLPPGLKLLKDFVNEVEEETILELINETAYEPAHSSLKHRLVKHYGYEFLYGSNQVDPEKPIDKKIPKKFDILWDKLRNECPTLDWFEPDQLTVNIYKVGQGIPPHVDTHSAFLDPILSLSLEDDVVMDFKNHENKSCSVFLPRRSLLVMSGESRYDWTHGIRPRVMDIIPSNKQTLTVRPRKQRTSLTFRRLRREACNCVFPKFCDTKLEETKQSKNLLASEASKIEMSNVHKVYNEIAPHFSETRHSPWPKVADFIKNFSTGDILLDIGCGNGKYLNISDKLMNIGCDRSEGLLHICKERKLNVFQCDCLSVPFRDGSVNGCISIAVIHHLATEKRRIQAIEEMARILCFKGKALIYVWAKNQSANSKKSSYLRQNKALNKNKSENDETVEHISCNNTKIKLPVHKNRTEFKEQDVLVPWKLKTESGETKNLFLRYYHVFEEYELENLCKNIDTIKVVKSYYDQGNWCVIVEKIK